MRTMMFSLLLLLPLAALAQSYGAGVPEGAAVPVAQALADVDAHAGRPAIFSGRIAQVCQNKGCWMILEDDGAHARVMMHEHSFFLPKDAQGRARVHGTLSRVELDVATAKHLAEDAGETGIAERHELRIEALGVEVEG